MSAAEKVEIAYFDDAANRYRVPKRQWRKWSALQRSVFNHVHSAMIGSPSMFQHPEFEVASGSRAIFRKHWKTTAWNAAWEAACAAGKTG